MQNPLKQLNQNNKRLTNYFKLNNQLVFFFSSNKLYILKHIKNKKERHRSLPLPKYMYIGRMKNGKTF